MTAVRHTGPLTPADRDALPEDGLRHELLDGAIVMTPSPGFRHQVIIGELFLVMRAACPAGLYVMLSPFDVHLGPYTVVVPDLIVSPRAAFDEKALHAAPLLAVEVLSPSTRRRDLGDKRGHYQDAGCASYWVIDPEGPRLLAWELRDGEYVEVADVRGTETFSTAAPYPVSFRPADLAL